MRSFKGKKENDPNQSKITQFFKKAPSTSTNDVAQGPRTARLRQSNLSNIFTTRGSTQSNSNRSLIKSEGEDDDDGILEVIEVPKPPPSPKELIVISSSDSESDGHENEDSPISNLKSKPVPPNPPKLDAASPCPHSSSLPSSQLSEPESTPESGSRSGSPSLLDCGLNWDTNSPTKFEQKQNEVDAPVPLEDDAETRSNMNLDRSGTFEDLEEGTGSSGDEILSQIDVEEVIRLSQSPLKDAMSTPKKQESPISSTSYSPFKEPSEPGSSSSRSPGLDRLGSLVSSLKSPKKSGKSQLTKFSPIRHLQRKRKSSEAGLGSPTTSGSKNVISSPSTPPTTSSPGRSPIKKLNFDPPPPDSTQTHGAGGRYYLRNFMKILMEVLSNKFNSHLISKEDHVFIQRFICLPLDAQSLYVRLFQRKWSWKLVDKLNMNKKYKELPENLHDLCRDLTEAEFFDQISASNATLEDILEAMDLPKILSLTKRMKVTLTKKSKELCKEAILKMKGQKTITGSSGTSPLVKHALLELGPCFRVSPESKELFSRLFILHSPPQYWEVETDQASNQLLIILLNAMGQMEYPTYSLRRETVIFRAREDLIKFHLAFQLHSNLVAWTEHKDWVQVHEVTKESLIRYEEIMEDEDSLKHDASLPQFLRIYTAGSVLCHTVWLGVDGLQKMKRFEDANVLIRKLMVQQVYLQHYRGRWWERLVINEGHLKSKKEDIKRLLEEALRDQYLQDNQRLILSQRLGKINVKAPPKKVKKRKPVPKSKTKSKKKYVDSSSSDEEVDDDENSEEETQVVIEGQLEILTLKHEIPTRTITGEKIDQGPGMMGKAVFISKQSSEENRRLSSVEQHCIDFYIEEMGFTHGLHGEGSTIVALFGILFWNVIFDDTIPDAFIHKYQGYPLDLHWPDFYRRRKSQIEARLKEITQSEMEDLYEEVDSIWSNNFNKLCIVNWKLFEDPSGLKSLMRAMGQGMISLICERLSRNYRYYHSGFPDLVVWSEGNGKRQGGKVLFVEVKGPGDSLRPKQQLWLEWMMENSVPCEVCLVKSVSNKRIRLGR